MRDNEIVFQTDDEDGAAIITAGHVKNLSTEELEVLADVVLNELRGRRPGSIATEVTR